MRSTRDHVLAAAAATAGATIALAVALLAVGCGPSAHGTDDDHGDDDDVDARPAPVCPYCTADLTGVVDCDGNKDLGSGFAGVE